MVSPFISILLLKLFPFKVWFTRSSKGKTRVCRNISTQIRKGTSLQTRKQKDSEKSELTNDCGNIERLELIQVPLLTKEMTPRVIRREWILRILSSQGVLEVTRKAQSELPENALESQPSTSKQAQEKACAISEFLDSLCHVNGSTSSSQKRPTISSSQADHATTDSIQYSVDIPSASSTKEIISWAVCEKIDNMTKDGKQNTSDKKEMQTISNDIPLLPHSNVEAGCLSTVFNSPRNIGNKRERLALTSTPFHLQHKGRSISTISRSALSEKENLAMAVSNTLETIAGYNNNGIENIYSLRRGISEDRTQNHIEMKIREILNSVDQFNSTTSDLQENSLTLSATEKHAKAAVNSLSSLSKQTTAPSENHSQSSAREHRVDEELIIKAVKESITRLARKAPSEGKPLIQTGNTSSKNVITISPKPINRSMVLGPSDTSVSEPQSLLCPETIDSDLLLQKFI